MVVLLQFAVGNVQSYVVVSRSMDPTLQVGDRVLMLREDRNRDLHGKVIAFEAERAGEAALTKRVLAEDGEKVDLRQGHVYVNGSREHFGKEPVEVPWRRSWQVGENQMFVAGDNRNNSFDSIDHGPVSRNRLLGVLVFRYWPLTRLGAVN
jgi:signal peptidase I